MIIVIKILLFLFFNNVYTAPVRKGETKPVDSNLFNDLHYKEYLEEVIKELENDKGFAERIKTAQTHNRSEFIANSLQFVHHQVRSKLDEIKRREIGRLNLLENELERQKQEKRGIRVPPPNPNLSKIISVNKDHLDHINVHTFEISDLEKLINKAEQDLAQVDTAQEQQYKDHEMKKEHMKMKKLESIKDENERKKLEEKFKESDNRHKNHSKVHHPGSEEQLKEVWDKNDHLDPKEFNAKAFFNLHDVNADGHLDINEIESLMQNELSKVYEANNSDDDMQEKYHEMMRMRQEMMNIMDKNKDNIISKEEFMQYTATSNFKEDAEWKTQEENNQKPYTDTEFKKFEEEYNQNDYEDDEDFSDMDDSLRYIPKKDNLQVPPSNAIPPPVQNDLKVDNQKGVPPKL